VLERCVWYLRAVAQFKGQGMIIPVMLFVWGTKFYFATYFVLKLKKLGLIAKFARW